MSPLTSARRAPRPFPIAWTVAIWLGAGTAAFVGLAWWWRAGSLVFMETELDRRFLRLGATLPLVCLPILLGVLLVESRVLGWRRSSLGRLASWSRSARADLLLSGLHILGWAPLVMTFFSAGWIWVIERLARHYAPLDLLGALRPVWVQFLAVLVVTDLLTYWSHRLAHDVDFLWEAHRYHHAATEFTILTGDREHALFEAFQHFVASIPLAALGVTIQQYVGARLVIYIVQLLQHSMVPWNYGWVGRWLIFSPVGHRIHHSPRADQHTSNYGDVLVIWDRLFGTWYGGEDVNETIGLPHNPYNRQGVIVEYLHAVARTVRALRTSIRTGRWRTGPGTTGG